jgi:hypothetical protein
MRCLSILLLIPVLANASGTDVVQQATAGDQNVTTGSSNALGFAHSLGDVDINDCLASTQWGTILVSAQKVVLNAWCAGEVYDAKGLPVMAAIMRCNIPEIRSEFDSETACREANTVTSPPQVVIIDDDHYEEEEEYHREQMQMQQDYDERIAQLEQRMNRPRSAPAPKPLLSEDQKKRLQEVLDE